MDNDLKLLPTSVSLVTVCILIVFSIMVLMGYLTVAFNSPTFLISQMITNFSFIYLGSIMYGIVFIQTTEESSIYWMKKYMVYVFPLFLMLAIFVKNMVFYSDSLKKYCKKKSNSPTDKNFRLNLILWNATKPLIAIFVVYFVVNMFTAFLMPFYEFFNDDHPIIYFVAMGFWLSFSTFPAEASAYFNLQQYGCIPSESIEFTNIDKIPDIYNPETNKV